MKLCFNDTETTGLPVFKEPSESPGQPHIVQLAAMLIDDLPSGPNVLGEMNVIVRPDGWSWTEEDEAYKAHGITMERAMDEGIPEAQAIAMFHELQLAGDMRVAHNGQFDDRIYRIAFKRYGDGIDTGDAHWSKLTQEQKDIIADTYKLRPSFCTMKSTTNVLQLPPTDKQVKAGFGRGFKNPKLSEAFAHYFGFEFDGAHNALFDVHACADVYFAIQRGITTPIFTVRGA